MSQLSSSRLLGPGLALLAFALFSSHDVIVKSLGGDYSPFQIVFFSVLLGLPLAMLMLMRDRTDGNLLPRYPGWTALRTVAAVVTGVSVFYAFSVLPLAQTYAILFATPLLITLLSVPVLGERVGWRRAGAVLVGLAGVLVVLRPGQETELGLGHLAALLGALGGATASIIVRKIGAEERNVVLLLYPMMANFLVMGAALPFVYRPMPLADFGAMAAMSVLALLASLCVIAAYKRAPAFQIAPMQYSQIIWAVLFGALFFGEAVDLYTILGAAIIIASGIFILVREETGNVSDNRPVLETRTRTDTGTYPRASRLGEAIEAAE
ncbi:DMT family transporter [Roseibaca sp. Y0-43]|uniref:DMT family transporter n=1 Tax=Roseibaca sp. Y0-43 TaxID=2816854 RepID=UPI001D0C3729|nr:DMT family transporter [Roseibaca sp. Y0-43]MCC1482645.1 DMT family transporter [Roseibaca sp. Y0-43]